MPELVTVTVEREFAHSPEKLWRALTQPHLIEEWLMQNDFRPVAGHKFSLSRQATPEIKVSIDCEVIEVEPNRMLSYKWQAYGTDTVVTFTLTPTTGGKTMLRVEQEGFPPGNRAAIKGARASWPQFLKGLEQLLDRTE